MKNILLLLIFLPICVVSQNRQLWYEHPASSWMDEALPIGNGYMGAMLFGGTVTDQIQLCEKTFWAGGPQANKEYRGGNRKDASKHLDEIRSLLAQGLNDEAALLAQKYMTGETHPAATGDDFGGHQGFGSLFVSIQTNDTAYSNYKRTLNLENAVATTSYELDGNKYQNEYFASYPARLIIARYSNKKGADYTLKFTSIHKDTKISARKNQLSITGHLSSNHLPFGSEIKIETDGQLMPKDASFEIKNAHNMVLYITIATNYRNHYPDYTGGDYRSINKKALSNLTIGYDSLKNAAIADYQSLYKRVSLTLGTSTSEEIPTDKRLSRYAQGGHDPQLEALYFQYGRYLLIESSRPGTLPANLQGCWNHVLNAPWTCDYHMNINLQMIYWHAEATNLAECHIPLSDYINTLREPGRITAHDYFNARGWCVNTMNNAYGYTAPGWDFNWGYAPNSAAWLCRHLWDHFTYSMDTTYLHTQALPAMKEACEFWLDYLVKDTNGNLVSSPSYSPEHGTISAGATIDQEIAWDLFSNTIKASEYVQIDHKFIDSIRLAKDLLAPLKIGRYGQLQEWQADLDDPCDEHRHISHLYALYPGNQISVSHTPKLAEAARRSLVYRGDWGTGWSLAWKINFWARLRDGNRSYQILRHLLTPASATPGGSGSYSNLLCSHPPYQIDGNMGAVAGMTELLLQSDTDEIELLPALPNAWHTGNITGLRARGGITVDMEWNNGLLTEAIAKASTSGKYTFIYQGEKRTVTLNAGDYFYWER